MFENIKIIWAGYTFPLLFLYWKFFLLLLQLDQFSVGFRRCASLLPFTMLKELLVSNWFPHFFGVLNKHYQEYRGSTWVCASRDLTCSFLTGPRQWVLQFLLVCVHLSQPCNRTTFGQDLCACRKKGSICLRAYHPAQHLEDIESCKIWFVSHSLSLENCHQTPNPHRIKTQESNIPLPYHTGIPQKVNVVPKAKTELQCLIRHPTCQGISVGENLGVWAAP